MKYVRYGVLAVTLSAVCLLSGCSMLDQVVGTDSWKEWTPTATTLEIGGDNTVRETIIDTLDQTWYTGNELQDMVARSMNEYNSSHAPDSLQVTSYSDTEGQVKIVLVYRTPEDYAAYNNVPFCSGSMLDAQMQGFLFDESFLSVSDSRIGSTVEPEEAISHKEYNVVISDGKHTVKVPGEIRYLSVGGQLVNSHVASPSGQEMVPLTDEELESRAGSGTEAAVQGQKEDAAKGSLFYVIYEKNEDTSVLPQAQTDQQ